MSDEIELEFKRFSKEKQEQIRQLIAYTTLMGLTGKDLVSIGGKLDRLEQKRDRDYRLGIVKAYDIRLIGADKTTHTRFKLKINDIWYHFKSDYTSFYVVNTKTNKSYRHYLDRDEWGRIEWRKREQYQLLWELHNGSVQLP